MLCAGGGGRAHSGDDHGEPDELSRGHPAAAGPDAPEEEDRGAEEAGGDDPGDGDAAEAEAEAEQRGDGQAVLELQDGGLHQERHLGRDRRVLVQQHMGILLWQDSSLS